MNILMNLYNQLLLNQVAQKQSQFQMLQIYTLNPLVSTMIISKMLYKLSLNKNPLQVQLNRLSDYFKHNFMIKLYNLSKLILQNNRNLAIEFRDQITDERQMKMTLFKIAFPSDKTLVQICKTEAIYTYFNDFLQQELILKLLTSKFESSSHYDMNLMASSTSLNYLFGLKQLKTPYLHYNQKFEKVVEEKQPLTSMPFINFNIKDPETEQKKGDKQFFGHLLKQKIKSLGSSIFKFKALGNNNLNQGSNLGMTNLVRQYRAAIKKKKTIQFNNEQTTVKYPNQQNQDSKSQKVKGGSTLCIFKEISPVNYTFVSKNNHFYQFNIFKKSLKVRAYLEMILYFAIFIYCMTQFFRILALTMNFQRMNIDFLNLMFGVPSDSLTLEIQEAYLTYTPTYTRTDISGYAITNVTLFCQLFIPLVTGNIQKYVTNWQDDCIIFMSQSDQANTVTEDFNRSFYFICFIPLGFLFKDIHSRIIKKKLNYDVMEYIDIFLAYLCIQYYFTNMAVMSYTDSQSTKPFAQDMVDQLTALTYVLTLIQFCLFCKVFKFLSRTEKLGVFIKILNLTIKQVFSFMFLFMLNILAFGSLLFLLSSYRLQLYNTFPNSIRTLIATSLGTFDYNDMNLAESLIQTVFLYSSNVIMINLLIAILTKTYSQITERGNVEYALILFEEYTVGKLDKNYSLMIAFPPPLNFFSTLFVWVLFFQKIKDFNYIFVKIGYSMILVVVFVVFFILNILIIPFTWLKMIFSIAKYQIQSIGLNIILQKRKVKNQKGQSCNRSYIWQYIYEWIILVFKLLQWIILGLPYLLVIAIFSDSYQFLKSAYNGVENKYQYKPNMLNTPIPQRCYYLIKCQPQLIDPRFRSDTAVTNFHLVSSYLKFKFLIKASKKDQEMLKSGVQPVLKNFFLKVLKQTQRRKKLLNQFQTMFDVEYQRQKEIQNDMIQNEHTDLSFLAIMRTKQIYYSTEFWEKNKVTSKRQSKFYNIALNPSIKHQIHVQQSLIRKVQSQTQNISNIRNIQKQMSSVNNAAPSSHNSLTKNNGNLIFHKQQTQKQKLHTLYEQTDAE